LKITAFNEYTRLISAEQQEMLRSQNTATERMTLGMRRIEEIHEQMLRDLLMAINDGDDEVELPGPGEGDTPSDHMKAILLACKESTAEDVVEPPDGDADLIDKRIRSPQGLGWSWAEKYVKNGQFAWCGAEMAYVMCKVGLKRDIRYKSCASCYRLQQFCANTPREIPVDYARPGDVVIWGNNKSPAWGSHVTILLERSESSPEWLLHEGNAKTLGPLGGELREGVGARRRNPTPSNANTYRAMFVYRFIEEDFD